MKTKSILIAGLSLLSTGLFTACQDMMETPSTMVLFTDNQKIDQPTDTVYSVIGIIESLQDLAVQNVLLGEIRGDMVDLTPQASTDLKELADFNPGAKNPYTMASKYYSVINHCNFYLANVDTSLKKRNEYIFKKEYYAVKTYRAWTYLQLVSTYGKVPLVTTPVLSEADAKKTYPMYDIKQICDYFINDLSDALTSRQSGYGAIMGLNSQKFFLPTQLVYADLLLWGGYYSSAASWYNTFLNNAANKQYYPLSSAAAAWDNSSTDFTTFSNPGYFTANDATEIISHIPLKSFNANTEDMELANIFTSTSSNSYYNQAKPSQSLIDLSKSQTNCIVYNNGVTNDTLYSPHNEKNSLLDGDLRLATNYAVTYGKVNSGENVTTSSLYNTTQQQITKFRYNRMYVYRIGQVYLRYAEALNRAGFHQSAFAVLKYGLYPASVNKYVSASERAKAGNLINFDQYAFTASNTIGIHSRGAGNAAANKKYIIPANVDTTEFVENLICDESALETSFEGYRYYDLLRIALRRDNGNEWFANKIANRGGAAKYNANLYSTLKNDKSKWFLPLR